MYGLCFGVLLISAAVPAAVLECANVQLGDTGSFDWGLIVPVNTTGVTTVEVVEQYGHAQWFYQPWVGSYLTSGAGAELLSMTINPTPLTKGEQWTMIGNTTSTMGQVSLPRITFLLPPTTSWVRLNANKSNDLAQPSSNQRCTGQLMLAPTNDPHVVINHLNQPIIIASLVFCGLLWVWVWWYRNNGRLLIMGTSWVFAGITLTTAVTDLYFYFQLASNDVLAVDYFVISVIWVATSATYLPVYLSFHRPFTTTTATEPSTGSRDYSDSSIQFLWLTVSGITTSTLHLLAFAIMDTTSETGRLLEFLSSVVMGVNLLIYWHFLLILWHPSLHLLYWSGDLNIRLSLTLIQTVGAILKMIALWLRYQLVRTDVPNSMDTQDSLYLSIRNLIISAQFLLSASALMFAYVNFQSWRRPVHAYKQVNN
jgi:hypothetical protein